MNIRRWRVVLAALAVVACMSALPAHAASPALGPGCQTDRRTVAYTTAAMVGGGSYTPCLIDTGMTSGESGIAIDSKGNLIRSVATKPIGVAVSTDSGATWKRRVLPAGAQSSIADGIVDPATDRYFYTGFAANDAKVYGTGNLGKSWTTGTFDVSLRQDWPKMFAGPPVFRRTHDYPSNIYYCNWTVPAGAAVDTVRCYKSIDGGKHFVLTGRDVYLTQVCADPTEFPNPIHGRGVVDSDGSIYLPVTICGHLEVAVSRNEGRTWTRHVVLESQSHVSYARPVLDTARSKAILRQALAGRVNPVNAYLQVGSISDAVAIDASGRLYATWIEPASYLPYVATSADGGQTWGPAIRVGPPGRFQGVLPSITVTPQGRVGLSYYGSTDDGASWTGYMTVIEEITARLPVLQTAAVTRSGHPLMNEPCCWTNGAQEYTAARWAPDGSLYAAFAGSRPSGDAEGFVGRLVRSTT